MYKKELSDLKLLLPIRNTGLCLKEIICQACSQAEAMNPVLQHKFCNLTLFSPKTCSDDIKWTGAYHFLRDHMSAKQWLRSACANADQSYCFALNSKTAKLSLDERQSVCLECMYAKADLSLRWAHMQSSRKCCVSAKISEILLAGFIFIKFLFTPMFCSLLSSKGTQLSQRTDSHTRHAENIFFWR